MERTVTVPSLRRWRARYGDARIPQRILSFLTRQRGIARASCVPIADGVHCGTDRHQPACHALDALHVRSQA